MTAPSPELVEEIARVISKAESDFMHPYAYDFAKSDDECVTFIARAVLSSPSIARALENDHLQICRNLESTPQATGLSAIAQERDEGGV